MDLTAHAGLTLVAETMLALGLDAAVEEGLRLRVRQRGFAEYAKLRALVLRLAAGGEYVEDVRVLAGDAGLARLLGGEVPSPDTLHDFLVACHDETALAQRPPEGAWIPRSAGNCRGCMRSTGRWCTGRWQAGLPGGLPWIWTPR